MRIATIGNVTVHTVMKSCKDSLHIVKVKIAFVTKIRAKKQITRNCTPYTNFLSTSI